MNSRATSSWLLVPMLLILTASALLAQEEPAGPAGAHQANRRRWQAMSEDERQQIRTFARGLTREEVRELRRRQAWFRTLTEDERERIRRNHHRFMRAELHRRRTLRGRHRRFLMLPEAEREELRRRHRRRRAGRRAPATSVPVPLEFPTGAETAPAESQPAPRVDEGARRRNTSQPQGGQTDQTGAQRTRGDQTRRRRGASSRSSTTGQDNGGSSSGRRPAWSAQPSRTDGAADDGGGRTRTPNRSGRSGTSGGRTGRRTPISRTARG